MSNKFKQVVACVEVVKARHVLTAIEQAAMEDHFELVQQLSNYLHEEMEGLAMIVKERKDY